ncbi:G-protein coupled receptor GRL101-like [Saccostrea cucullata]|uniref:G-protein coupled receptor GRL101-like n=1 Tax=Saccostrea cuccullata TaxID=36930 RepID=UPI002ED442E1
MTSNWELSDPLCDSIVFRVLNYVLPSYGIVFLYNISITKGLCSNCGQNEFRCHINRAECVPLSKVCDLQPDCLNGEDEKECDLIDLWSHCSENLFSTSGLIKGQQENSSDGNNTLPVLQLSRLNICYDGDQCQYDPSYSCSLRCPINCTCSGLSFICSSENAPYFATSITFTGLEQRALVISGYYVNLKELRVVHCKLQYLNITSTSLIETLFISHSSIGFSLTNDEKNKLRFVRIFKSTFDTMRFIREEDHTFNFYVRKSKVKSTNKKDIYRLGGLHVDVDISESEGFPFIIGSILNNPVVNFSSCNLNIQPDSYIETVNLDLSHNFLTKWHMTSIVQIVHLQGNLLESINCTFDFKRSESYLQYLDLSFNYLSEIKEDDFIDFPNILYLKLRNNRISDIHENAFSVISKIIYLDLSNNNLRLLTQKHFLILSSLQYLYLHKNKIKILDGMFDGLLGIQYLQVESFTLCCAKPKTEHKSVCSAPVNEISSCSNLIDTPLLRIIIWYMALFSVFGNLFGLLYRFLVLQKKKITSFDIYSMNLGLADFLMGVYLYIIAIADLIFNGQYAFEDESWRHTPQCTFAGVLATTSSEASALFVLIITIDRILVIRFPFSILEKNRLTAKVVSLLVWTVSLLLSLLPLFGNQYFDDYYSSSGICISLPLSVLRKPGWEYSMVIFVGANFIIFIAILVGQFIIFIDVVRMRKRVNLKCTSQKKREISLAKTLIMVAVTDMLCWIPIGVIGFLTFVGIDVTTKAYAWVIVVVLPINSALNPIIYTFSAILRHRFQKAGQTNGHNSKQKMDSQSTVKEQSVQTT